MRFIRETLWPVTVLSAFLLAATYCVVVLASVPR